MLYEQLDPLWWEETDPIAAGRKALAVAQAIDQQQQGERDQNLRHAKLFANQDLSSIYDYGIASGGYGGVYLSVNVIESCANTLVAKITRTRVRPTVMTEKGKRSLRRAAEDMTAFIDGVYYQSELHEGEGEQMFVDAELFGTGVAYVDGEETDDAAEVMVDRVLRDEILVDPTEAMYGKRSLKTVHRKKYIHREVLLRMKDERGKRFGDDKEKREAIQRAQAFRRPGADSFPAGGSEMVPVYLSHRLPSKRGETDGGFIVTIPGGDGGTGTTLRYRRWKRSRLPYEFFTFQRRPVGLWGRSLAEQLVPIQLKINEVLEVIDEGQRLNAQVRIFVQDQMVNQDDLDNLVAAVIKTNGPPSQAVYVHEGKGASAEMYQDLETWIRRAYEITGISMLSATAEKPEGVGSAVALRELLDREDLRFSALGKRWERFHRDIGSNIVETADELYENKKKISITVPGDKFIRKIDFGAINLPRDLMTVTVAAASAMPSTPAAKRQYAKELQEMGAITMARFLELIDEPDTKAATSMVTAAQDAIEKDLEYIVENGKWRAPDRLLDPALARDLAVQEYAKARHEGVDAKRMDLLRRYIKLTVRWAGGPQGAQQAADQAAAAEQQEQGGTPEVVAAAAGAPLDEVPLAAAAPDLAAAAVPPAPSVPPVA